jgi:hypothetical protein
MYNSFLDFIKKHNIQQETIDKCFGKGYFGKYVMYDNCKAINKLAKYLNLGITVKTVHPTWNTVAFKTINTVAFKTIEKC